MKRPQLACSIIAAALAFAVSSDAAATAEPSLDGLWIGSEVGNPASVAIRINTEHKTIVFVDEYFVYFGNLQAQRKVGKKGSKYRTKTTITKIVDIKGDKLPKAKVPAVTHARWAQVGDKVRMCAGGPGSKVVPKSADKAGPKIRCFELERA